MDIASDAQDNGNPDKTFDEEKQNPYQADAFEPKRDFFIQEKLLYNVPQYLLNLPLI